MAISIAAAIERIKSEVGEWLTPQSIEQICDDHGHKWRDRVLGPAITIQLFLLQILNGNTANSHVPRLANIDCTGEAYGQARGRIPLEVYQGLLAQVTVKLPVSTADEGRWRGHRTFLIDGSNTSMPDTPALQEKYGQPSSQAPGCGFPIMHLMAMFQSKTGFLMSLESAPYRTHDMSQVQEAHSSLGKNDILVGDRGLGSFVHLALLGKRDAFGLFRTHQNQVVNFRPGRRHATDETRKNGEKGLPTSRWVKRLGKDDQLVEYVKPKVRPNWMTDEEYAQLPETILVRELRYSIADPGGRTQKVTLSTTLLDPVKYPAAEVAKLYGLRWEIETNFDHLKTTLKMDVLHCKTVAGVEKELTMYALVYNLIRLVMLEAARRQKVPVDRISFVDADRWLAQAMDGYVPLKLRVNPHRPNRVEPRVRKRRSKNYPLMRKPRAILQKELKNKGKSP